MKIKYNLLYFRLVLLFSIKKFNNLYRMLCSKRTNYINNKFILMTRQCVRFNLIIPLYLLLCKNSRASQYAERFSKTNNILQLK